MTHLVEALRYKSEGLGFAAVQTDGVRIGEGERMMWTDGNVPYWTRTVLSFVWELNLRILYAYNLGDSPSSKGRLNFWEYFPTCIIINLWSLVWTFSYGHSLQRWPKLQDIRILRKFCKSFAVGGWVFVCYWIHSTVFASLPLYVAGRVTL